MNILNDVVPESTLMDLLLPLSLIIIGAVLGGAIIIVLVYIRRTGKLEDAIREIKIIQPKAETKLPRDIKPPKDIKTTTKKG